MGAIRSWRARSDYGKRAEGRPRVCPPRSGGRGPRSGSCGVGGPPHQPRLQAFDPPTSRLASARRQGPSPSLRLGDNKPPRGGRSPRSRRQAQGLSPTQWGKGPPQRKLRVGGPPHQPRLQAFDPPTSRLASARRQGPSPSLRLGDKPPRGGRSPRSRRQAQGLSPTQWGKGPPQRKLRGRGTASPTPLAGLRPPYLPARFRSPAGTFPQPPAGGQTTSWGKEPPQQKAGPGFVPHAVGEGAPAAEAAG
jgi:hypothetical protein